MDMVLVFILMIMNISYFREQMIFLIIIKIFIMIKLCYLYIDIIVWILDIEDKFILREKV